MIGKEIFFFFKAAIFAFIALILIPKELYRKYLVYGLFFGGLGDYVMTIVLEKIFHLMKYKNMGIFNIADLASFWTPIAWMCVFSFFLYLLPQRKTFLIPYILGFAIFGHTVGLTLQNIGLFQYNGAFVYFAPLVFILWFSVSAWIFIRIEKIRLQ
jgi:hypothetical protein